MTTEASNLGKQDFEPIIVAIRENDRQTFIDHMEKLSVTELNATNTIRYASWFSGLGATLLQLTSFVRPEFARILLDRGAAWDLHSACALSDTKVIQDQLKDPSRLESQIDGYFPMQFALGQPNAVRMLVEYGDAPNRSIQKLAWFEWEDVAAEAEISDWTPMHMLALGRGDEPHVNVADALREYGADITSSSTPFGQAPIHLSAITDRRHLISWFVKNGCPVDIRTKPLHSNEATVAELFPTEPFGPFFSTSEKTALMCATGEGHFASVKLLLELGADVSAADSAGFTALHYAAGSFWREQSEIVELLLQRGAQPATTSEDGARPADIANGKGYGAVLKLLK